MSLINVKNLTFYYDGSHQLIFDQVSFQIDTRWRLGLTGRNGQGKTTLCRLLMGQLDYEGEISAPVEFDYFPYPVKAPERETARILSEICPEAQPWEIERELALLQIDAEVLARPFASLSHGERSKLLLAALFLKDSGFLLIDEPTNHLDMAGRCLVSRYLRGKEGFLLISHDRAFLDGCVDHILAINRSSIQIQKGNFSTWFYNRQLQDAHEEAENEKLRREIRRLEKTAREKADWSDRVEKTKYASSNSGMRPDRGYIGHQSAKMMGRAKAIEKRRQTAVEEKSGLLKERERTLPLKLTPLRYRSHRLITCRDLSIRYPGGRELGPVSFSLDRGERLALQGKNGCGKTSLLKLLCGEALSCTGQLEIPGDLIVSHIPQGTESLGGTLREYAAEAQLDEGLFKTILHYLGFEPESHERDMRGFSEGQKKKVLLARSLCTPAHLYIWDEPLNYIDVISRMQIEKLLEDYAPTMIFVEHDAAFSQKIATRTVAL